MPKEIINHNNLFKEFSGVTKEDWEKKVLEDLKGKTFESLLWTTDEGFVVRPNYTNEDLKDLSYLTKQGPGFVNTTDKNYPPRKWINNEFIEVSNEKTANTLALDALNMGADGIVFDLSKIEEIKIDSLLNDIHPHYCEVSFIIKSNALETLKKFFHWIDTNNFDPGLCNGFYHFDPIASWCLSGVFVNHWEHELSSILRLTEQKPFYGLTINSQIFHNSGANIVQELAFSLSMAVAYIEKIQEGGNDVETVIKNIAFSIGTGDNYFMEIAKLRALRILFQQIANAYGVNNYKPNDLKINSVSSIWTKTLFDPYVNMLRNTTEAMSAIIGGCDSMTILPHDIIFRDPSSFSRRISRNISNVLKEEAYFDKVVDPGAGSYYIENLTDLLIKESWQLFQEIEANGGFIKSFEKGVIQSKIESARKEKSENIATRKDTLVGINQYVDGNEKPEFPALKPDKESKDTTISVLPQLRLASDFEKLRVNALGNKKSPILLMSIGKSFMQKARVSFSNSFFACGGFETTALGPFSDLEKAVLESKKHPSQIIVICGSDDDYKEYALPFVKTFRVKDRDKTLLLAGNLPELRDVLMEDGLDGFINLQSNVIEVLTRLQQKLGMVELKASEA
ncbi:methylmalonyl-CoA mutase family protein [Fulvivirgaceae bacterium BMA10]|uniref:Methylmalonyl-CoA mutase family protein n=1 Tax=Splendidivirga corallicola TaxID=3051826 RepID=A0ABT8KRH8_9BACT|nr:methylmalonyl-CoA mutase family protein [Fulvivirgaceae bacterium BMA10]